MTATTSTPIRRTLLTGNNDIDGLSSGTAWDIGNDLIITYAFPDSAEDYGDLNIYKSGWGGIDRVAGMAQLTAQARNYARSVLDTSDGNDYNDAFSIEGFTNARFGAGSDTNSLIRIAQTPSFSTAATGTPDNDPYMHNYQISAGDSWFNKSDPRYDTPVSGSYGGLQYLHEMGHAMGMKHPHENVTYPLSPNPNPAAETYPLLDGSKDALEYTVMSYKSYIGASNDYTNAEYGFPQTYMQLDVQWLQKNYGADFTANSGNTTYSWSPTSGDTLIDGHVAINAASKIFATIWDGGGVDTYDLSAYTNSMEIRLAPGGSSLFSSGQLAQLSSGANAHYAQGNIYNAYQYQSDARSLIENAVGGAGGDLIGGNAAANKLSGGAGNDSLYGFNGNDTLYGNEGDDILYGGPGDDILNGGVGNDTIYSGDGNDSIVSKHVHTSLKGAATGDSLSDTEGTDIIIGGKGADTFVFAPETGSNIIMDFTDGEDKISFNGLDFSSFADLYSSSFNSKSGLTIRLGDGADDLVIMGLNRSQLDTSDFALIS